MNYTKNYRLPQWVKEDRIMMDDFNAMNTSIENGLTRTDAKAASAVSSAARAEQTAASAVDTANAAAAARPYAVGTYTGSGGTKTIELGFRPSFVVVSGVSSTVVTNDSSELARYFAMTAGNTIPTRIQFTDTGFTVYPMDTEHKYYPCLNAGSRTYDFIAFK